MSDLKRGIKAVMSEAEFIDIVKDFYWIECPSVNFMELQLQIEEGPFAGPVKCLDLKDRVPADAKYIVTSHEPNVLVALKDKGDGQYGIAVIHIYNEELGQTQFYRDRLAPILQKMEAIGTEHIF